MRSVIGAAAKMAAMATMHVRKVAAVIKPGRRAIEEAMRSAQAVMCSAPKVIVIEAISSATAHSVTMCSAIAQARDIKNGTFGATNARPSTMSAKLVGTRRLVIGANIGATSVKIGGTIAATHATAGASTAAMSARTECTIGVRRGSAGTITAGMFTSRIGIAGAFATTIASIAIVSIESITFRGGL